MPRAKSDAGGDEGDKLDFESSMKRLVTIVEELEGGELSLEDSIARYEEGMKLSRRLTQVLDESEKRIERLIEKGGEPTTEDMGREGRDAGRSGESGGRELPEGELPF